MEIIKDGINVRAIIDPHGDWDWKHGQWKTTGKTIVKVDKAGMRRLIRFILAGGTTNYNLNTRAASRALRVGSGLIPGIKYPITYTLKGVYPRGNTLDEELLAKCPKLAVEASMQGEKKQIDAMKIAMNQVLSDEQRMRFASWMSRNDKWDSLMRSNVFDQQTRNTYRNRPSLLQRVIFGVSLMGLYDRLDGAITAAQNQNRNFNKDRYNGAW